MPTLSQSFAKLVPSFTAKLHYHKPSCISKRTRTLVRRRIRINGTLYPVGAVAVVKERYWRCMGHLWASERILEEVSGRYVRKVIQAILELISFRLTGKPASACGLYGFKPTAGILPLIGFRNHGCILGVDRESLMPRSNILQSNVDPDSCGPGIPPTQGPMGHSIRDLELYMQVVLAANPAVREPK